MVGAAFLLAAAGAATVAAVPSGSDTTGNGLALNGSDTLFDVTNTVINNCPTQFSDFATHNISYLGGGSGVGAGAMGLGSQQISPMSKAMSAAQFCTGTGTSASFESGKAEDLLVGIDGVAIATNRTNSCSSTVANGFGKSSFSVTSDGSAGGTAVVNCPGCAAGTSTYTLNTTTATDGPSFDALRILYFGLTHNGSYDCAGSVRKSLIRNWKNLFASDCSAGDATCSAGLTHAWRRSDLSGTTDAFVGVLNPPNGTTSNGKGAAVTVGIGSLPTVTGPGSGPKSNPFCNSSDANASPATTSFGGSSDQQDKDPIRTPCNDPNDGVCAAFPNLGTTGVFAGDLGVVLPILIPDATTTHGAPDLYPTIACGTACTLIAPIKGNQVSSYPGLKCPDGSNLIGGKCYIPFAGSAASPNPQCIAASSTKCASEQGKPDGRRYNLAIVVPATQIPSALRGTAPFQIALDANANILSSAGFYRIHSTVASPQNVPDANVGQTGICQENDDTSQIGCLTDSDPCSVGYAGREAAKSYPGLGSGGVTAPLKALSVNGTPPFTPSSVDPDPDKALKNLLQPAGTTPLYPLARRLYLATIFGFSNLLGGESELAACYGNNNIIGPAISGHGFVPIPGGVQCLDYPEDALQATPLPNSQGSGNIALGGCSTASTTVANTNACTSFPPSITN
jgi:hypothetical protein